MGVSLALLSSFQWKKRSSKVSMRNRKRRRGKNWVLPEIPLDLVIEILTRLPAKLLMRFKCASKFWYALIRSRYFSNRYLTMASPQPPPRVFMSLVEHLECGSMEVCHNPSESVLLSLSSSSSSASCFHLDFTMPGMGGRNMVVLRGLILYIVCTKACIYNPATRQSVTLPAVKSSIVVKKGHTMNVSYLFGHNPVLDQYKVICIVAIYSKHSKRKTSEHWVRVLEAGGSWKRIECDQPHLPTRQGLCINGVIYYLAITRMSRDIVFSFDLRSEEFNMIQVPAVVSECESVGFIEYGGKPAIFDHTHLRKKGLVNLWVLEDGKNWSIKSLVLPPCQMYLVNISIIPLMVQGTTQNGEVILAPVPLVSPYYILYYDLVKNDLRQVEVRGIPYHRYYFYLKLMDTKTANIMHLET